MKAILAAIVLVVPVSAQTTLVKTLNIGDRPESVCRGFDGKLYVTVMNSKDTAGDAVIKVVDGDKISTFATGMDEPKGIAFTGDHLITADSKQVWKIDAKGKASVLAAADAFPHPPVFLNDVAVAPDGKSVFVTDTGDVPAMLGPDGLWPLDSPQAKEIPVIGRVYQIQFDGKVTVAIDACPEMLNPNGVTSPEAGLLLVAEFFKGNILIHRDGKLTILNTGLRGGDGIERDSKGNLYVSSWTQGKVWKLDPDAKKTEVIIKGHKAAADFLLDEKNGLLILPDMTAGTLSYYKL
jgi:sugar lactone lactonase YvrE